MDYGGINAKIKAMRSCLLKRQDYEALCRMSSVQEVGLRLKSYPAYMKELAQLDGAELHRGLIERKLMLSLSSDNKRIYSFIGDHNLRQYLNILFFTHVMEVIDFLLCTVFDEREIDYPLSDLVAMFGNRYHIDFSKLKDSKTVSDFIDNLNGTDFYSLLAGVYRENDSASLFKLQMQLDLYYYMHLWKKQNQYLDKKNLEIMSKIKGTEVDLRNIMWTYRLKKYYRVENSLIYAYMIPVNYKLKVSQLSKMVEAADEDALHAEILASPYGKAFAGSTSIEQVFYREMSKVYRKAQRASPNSLASVAGYLYDKQMEIKNITALLEGVRYGLDPVRIMNYINLPESMEVSS